MLPLIPSMMLLTVMLVYVLSPAQLDKGGDPGKVVESNLLLYHSKAVEVAMASSMANGYVHDPLSGPFNTMGDWQSQVVSGDTRTVVVTHLPDGVDDEPREVIQAFSEVGEEDLYSLPESYAGLYLYSANGVGGTVGDGVFTDIDLPVMANTPAIVTVIKQGGA